MAETPPPSAIQQFVAHWGRCRVCEMLGPIACDDGRPLWEQLPPKGRPGGRKVGFWRETEAVERPPILPWPADSIDPTWTGPERDALISYITRKEFRSIGYMGISDCRICGTDNGSYDFSDGEYTWPEGFAHYISEHNVKPPQAFLDHVKARV